VAIHKKETIDKLSAQTTSQFMLLASEAAQRSNCIRRSVGAVVVRDGNVLVKGWNGVSHEKDCGEAGCPRCIQGGDTGSGYENCICVHAEQRAIAEAASRGIVIEGATLFVNLRPCLQCLAISKAAGISGVVFSGEDWNYPPDLEKIYQKLARQFAFFLRMTNPVQTSASSSR